MSTVALCVYCESLPEIRGRSAARKFRCPLCHSELGADARGAKFRLRVDGDGRPPMRYAGSIAVLLIGVACSLAGFCYAWWPLRDGDPATTAANSLPAPATVVDESAPDAASHPTEAVHQPEGAQAKPYTPRYPRVIAKASPYRAKPTAELPLDARRARIANLPGYVVPPPADAQALLMELGAAPELALWQSSKSNAPGEARTQLTEAMNKIRELNAADADGHVRHLRKERTDLAGLPWILGDACRLPTSLARQLEQATTLLRDQGRGFRSRTAASPRADIRPDGTWVSIFWNSWEKQKGLSHAFPKKNQAEGADESAEATESGIRALAQILGPEAPEVRYSLAGKFGELDHAKAAEFLVALAVFDVEQGVRDQATDALRRFDRAATVQALMKGFRHPWPAAAHHASRAIVRLQLKEAVPYLIDFLEEPDPAAPTASKQDGKTTWSVRELVRLNHHRNCALCHPPLNKKEEGFVRGGVPDPTLPLPPSFSPAYYYSGGRSEFAVRADTTYLRQDFSVMLPVENAKPWPEMQRFDFLVRTRMLSDDEAAKRQPMAPWSSQHQAALDALRATTGQDHGPTAAAWRKATLLSASGPRPGESAR